jgi:hypothetical protein
LFNIHDAFPELAHKEAERWELFVMKLDASNGCVASIPFAENYTHPSNRRIISPGVAVFQRAEK